MSKIDGTADQYQSQQEPGAQSAIARRAWVVSVLQRRPDLLARLAYFRERLLRLPRSQRRWLLRRAALPLSAAALMLALSAAPQGLRAESAATIAVSNDAVAVKSDGICSLIEAINNANANAGQPHADCVAGNPSGADTIVLPGGGLFNVKTSDNDSDYGYNGLPEITSTIIIDGNGATIRRTGNEEFRFFNVVNSGDLTLNEVTLTGGDPGYYYGGAINVYQGKLTINDSTLTGNESEGGGAISAQYSEVTINGSTLTQNVAYVGGAVDVRYSTLTISDSEFTDNTSPGDGFGASAIYSLGDADYDTAVGLVTISDTTISGNNNEDGAALMVTEGTLVLTGSTISDNSTVYGYGAGMALNGVKATITGVTISGNESEDATGGGLAIFAGITTITGSVIETNRSASDGGGIYARSANLTIDETTISNNTADKRGGGLMLAHADEPNVGDRGEALVVNSTLSGNSAETGGGIHNTVSFTLANSTLSQNEARSGGGAANAGVLQLVNSTVTRNRATAGDGGGLFNFEIEAQEQTPGQEGTLLLRQALISGNSASGAGPEVQSTGQKALVSADRFNLFGANGLAGVMGFEPGASDIVPTVAVTAVLQNALADNGGPTLTHALVPNSPAIDAGPSEACAAAPINGVDQRGEPRNRNADGIVTENECDLGAFEAPGAKSDVYLPAVLKQ